MTRMAKFQVNKLWTELIFREAYFQKIFFKIDFFLQILNNFM